MYNLQAIVNPETFPELSSNVYGLATFPTLDANSPYTASSA